MQIVVKLMHARSTTVLQVGEGAESSLEELSTRHFKVAATQVKSAHQGRKAAGCVWVEGGAWGASFEVSREAMGAVRREMALVRSEESACVRERSCLYTRLPHAHAHKPRAPMWDCCTYGSQAHRSRAWVTDTDCSDASPDCLGILPDHVLGLALLLRARIATRHVRWGDREGKRERSGLQVDDL